MEKRIFLLIFLCIHFFCFAQEGQNKERIKIHIWAEVDAYPALKEAQDLNADALDYPTERITKTAPFFINGMVYGWNFTYIPSDKMRSVEDFFEIQEIGTVQNSENSITYEKPWIQDNLIHVWALYERTSNELWEQKRWQTVNIKKAQGRGKGRISKGFDGLTEAAANAVKDAVRSYYRPILKNKPKEISGRVLISKEPKIAITEGQYVVQLDFFVETDRIVKYTMY